MTLWRYLGLTLGRRRRRRFLLQPALAGILALLEATVLLSLVRLLLLLIDGEDVAQIHFLAFHADASFTGLAVAGLTGALLAILIRIAEARFTGSLVAEASATARRQLVELWFRADWQYLQGNRLGRLQQLLGVNSQRAGAMVGTLALVSLAGLSLVLSAGVVLAIAPVVLLLFTAIGAVTAAIFSPIRMQNRRAGQQASERIRNVQLSATTYVSLGRELQVFGVADAAVRDMGVLTDGAATAQGSSWTFARMLPGIYQQVLLAAVIALVAAARVLGIDADQFGIASILAVRSLSYVQQLNAATATFAESQPYLDELVAELALLTSLERCRGDRPLQTVTSLELRSIEFAYPGGGSVLRDVSLRIRSGEWIGLVGPSGAGKTTLANVLAGLLVPTGGDYLVNGLSASDYSGSAWASQFAILSQEPTLLRATVEENIRFHRQTDLADVVAAARSAGIATEIEGLAEGYDTAVGEGQMNLSGGQRQRVALARALAGNPSVLVLDEPTSALDDANSELIEAALSNLHRGTIVIIVSHRPALLRRCTRVFEVVDGSIEACGHRQNVVEQ